MIEYLCYIKKVRIFDPVSRQTFTAAKQQPSNNKQNNLFQLYSENDNSWIDLTIGITQVAGHHYLHPEIRNTKWFH